MGLYLTQHYRDTALFRGCLPRVFEYNPEPGQAYSDYLRTYVERDVRQLVNVRNLQAFELFLKLLASRVGQVLNLASLATDVSSEYIFEQFYSFLQLALQLPPSSCYHPTSGHVVPKLSQTVYPAGTLHLLSSYRQMLFRWGEYFLCEDYCPPVQWLQHPDPYP